MLHRTFWAFVSIIVLAASACGGGGSETAAESAAPAPPPAAAVDPASAGSIMGMIKSKSNIKPAS